MHPQECRERNRKKLEARRRRLLDRIANQPGAESEQPMITASNIHYELGRSRFRPQSRWNRCHAVAGTEDRLDPRHRPDLHVLKRHCPYHESDHVLNIAFNILAGGNAIEHIELQRNDEVYLDALGAQRLPDPTTEGDFCRRFLRAMSLP